MLEFALDFRRGGFHLQTQGRLASDWTVIFGASGAGKSTLLRLLAGLQSPDRGHIAYNDETLYDSARRIHHKPGGRKIAMVSQQPALFPHMSVKANVGYGLFALGGSERSDRVEQMLDLVDASELADRHPRQLSGGEAQRVALARALAPLPGLLLLDEPFSALDGAASDALMTRLHAWLRSHQVQTILVTHDATDAYASNAEVALMQEGKIVAIGSPAVVLETERRRILARLGDQ